MHTDGVHGFGDHRLWTEGYHFNFYDRAKDVCGFMKIDLRPNLGLKEMFCHFMMPDGSIVGLRDHVPFDGTGLAAKGLRLEMLEPERLWSMSFAGGMERMTERKAKKSHVEFDLRFEALNHVFDYRSCTSGGAQQTSVTIAFEHLEQVGRIEGTLSTGLDDFKISALGERSHSWGVRDWNTLSKRSSLTCQFSDSHALNLTRLVSDDGVVDAGFVFQEGRNIPVVSADLRVNMDFGKNPMSFETTLRDGDGGIHKVFGSVVKRMPMQFKSDDSDIVASVNETLSRYNFAGKTGYGIAEFLHRTE